MHGRFQERTWPDVPRRRELAHLPARPCPDALRDSAPPQGRDGLLPGRQGAASEKYDLGIGAGSKRTAPASELLFRMVCHSANSWRTSREVFSLGYCPWCSPYHPKLLNDIDTICGDMALIEGVDLALDVSDQHGVHLTMSHDNDIDRAWIPINYCPICGRNFRKDR